MSKQQKETGPGLATVPGPAQGFLAAAPGLPILFHTLFPIVQPLLEDIPKSLWFLCLQFTPAPTLLLSCNSVSTILNFKVPEGRPGASTTLVREVALAALFLETRLDHDFCGNALSFA